MTKVTNEWAEEVCKVPFIWILIYRGYNFEFDEVKARKVHIASVLFDSGGYPVNEESKVNKEMSMSAAV